MLKRRMMLFSQLALFTSNISSSIRYNAFDIYTVLQQECVNTYVPFVNCALNNLQSGLSVSQSWSSAVDSLPSYYGLSKDDKNIIKQFGSKLGATDTEGQTIHCEYFKNMFSARVEQLQDEYSKKSRLYRSLGFFCGLALVIVLI